MSWLWMEIASAMLGEGGGGGGRPESAQAGGRYPNKLAEALSLVPDIVSKSLKES